MDDMIVMGLFDRFTSEADRQQLEPHDWLQFYDLIVHIYRFGGGGRLGLGPLELPSELISRGFGPEMVTRLSDAFDAGIGVLRAYERSLVRYPKPEEGSR
jgi:hypothetical protein